MIADHQAPFFMLNIAHFGRNLIALGTTIGVVPVDRVCPPLQWE
jgi:hypothetical protein